ncbi:PLP-dependent transferase [Pluteus cervinus]|uniref:PLP-dependent transferase n=1 Tax=Pluteus cervinus TaxID=181527 RepID=A0ACD3B413_9AGAR|nr:PLP-dependent transferase [Pluteus cervinus]
MSRLGFRLSRSVLSTISPPIARAYEWAASYPATPHRPLLDMSQGSPGIPPPQVVRDALAKASSDTTGYRYLPVLGDEGLRQGLAVEMKRAYGQDSDILQEDVAITAGCNLAFVAAVMALADAGDEVILPIPWYFNHQMSLNLLGMKAVPLPTFASNGFLPSIEVCRRLISPKTRAIVLVTPNNPTGSTYPATLLDDFLTLAQEHKIALVIDETYRDFIPTGAPHNIFSNTQWRSNFVHLFSFSKSYCVPGLRLGAIVGSPTFLAQVVTTLDCLQICAPRQIQVALAPLLPSLRGFITENSAALQHRHALFRDNLPSTWIIGSQGAYYAFVKHPYQGISAEVVCKQLAMEIGVATLPISFFRDENGTVLNEEEDRWIRFSVANVDDEKVIQVCQRLAECDKIFGDGT